MFHKDNSRSWIVLFATTTLMFIETGVVKSLGVLLPNIREQFATKTWVIGFAISLTPGFGAVVCILAGAVNKVLEPRMTIILCAALCSIGLFATVFVKNVYAISTTLLLSGFATGTTSVAGGTLSHHFDKYYDFAASTSLSGMSLGMVVMPLVTQLLLDIYGWRGTILLLTGISIHGVICGTLFIPNKTNGYKNISSTDATNVQTSNVPETSHRRVITTLKDYLDITLFSNFAFITVFSLFAGNGFYTTGWLIYVVPHVIEVGFSPYEASLVATIGGFANFVGNFSHPLAEKILSREAQLFASIFMISASLALDAIAIVYSSYVGFVLCAVVFGLGRGLMVSAVYPILNDAVDDTQMINAMGWVYAAYGLASVLSGFTCGWLYDQSGTYIYSFLVLGAFCFGTSIPRCILVCRTVATL